MMEKKGRAVLARRRGKEKTMQVNSSIQTDVLSTFPGDPLPGFFSSPLPSGGGVPVALDKHLKIIKHHISMTSLPDYRQEKALKMLDCGGTETYKVFCVSPTGCQTVFDAPRHCGSRLCASCNGRAAKKLAASWRYRMQDTQLERLALLTLTMRISATYTLAERYELAYTAVRKLVRQQLFTSNVSGYVRKIEVKPASRGGWNVHIHMIVEARNERKVYRIAPGKRRECDFYPADGSLKLSRQTISDAWRLLTGGSHMTDLTPVSSGLGRSAAGAIGYLLKYMLKREGFSADTATGVGMIYEYQRTLKGRRTIQAGGEFHAAHKHYSLRRPAPKVPGCRHCGGKQITQYQLHNSVRRLEKRLRSNPRYKGVKLTNDTSALSLANQLIPSGVPPDLLKSLGVGQDICAGIAFLGQKINIDMLSLITYNRA